MSTTQLLPTLRQQFFDANGNILAGGSVYTYAAGSTTPLATYTDQTGATPNTNPIVLDTAGSASIWLSSSAYKFAIYNSLGSLIRTIDNVKYINLTSIDNTMVNSDLAGVGLAQNTGTLAFDVQVDNVSLEIVNNELQVKPGGITANTFASSSKLEVLYKNVRDLTCPGLIQEIPQYEWSSPSLLTNPGTLPGSGALACKWSPNGEFLAVACGTTPYILIYQRSVGTLTKLSNPGTLPVGQVDAISWSPCGDFLAVGCIATSSSKKCLFIYQRSGNSFSYLTNTSPQSGASTITCNYLLFSPNSDFLAFSVTGTGGATFYMYERSGTTFTDITTTSTLSGIQGPLTWFPDSSKLAAIDTTTSAIDVFTRADNVFTSTTGPTVTSYEGDIIDIAYSPDQNFLAVALNVTPFVLLFSISAGVYTQLSNPATLPPGAASCVSWSANSEYLLVGDSSGTSPYLTIYQVTNPTTSPTFTKITAPSVPPAAAITSGHWSQTKQFLAVSTGTTPYVQVYETASTLPSNALLWTREAPNV